MGKENVEVPSVGESITEVSIASFLVANGSVVNEGDPIIELESDKATMEVPAPLSGKVTFTVKEGDTVAIGAKIAEIDTDAKVEAKIEKQERRQKRARLLRKTHLQLKP